MADDYRIDRHVFTRILVGTDGSERAEAAIAHAVRLASIAGAPLDMLFVIDTGRPHDRPVEPIADAALGRAAALTKDLRVESVARMTAGDPAERLMQETADKRVDLLCVGPDAGLTTGPPRIGRVAKRLLREAPCSVLIARSTGANFPSRIVCGVDGSRESVELAAFAAAIAAAADAELHLVHVAASIRRRGELRRTRAWLAGPQFETLRREADATGVAMRTKVVRGRPERRLVAAAKRLRSDLLIVGHRGVSGVRRAVLGSVSERSAHTASCSVLVSRPVADE
jgi:nucleotide-binding universal stress UspA family protein